VLRDLAAEITHKPVINAGDSQPTSNSNFNMLFTMRESQGKLDNLQIALVVTSIRRTIHSLVQVCAYLIFVFT